MLSRLLRASEANVGPVFFASQNQNGDINNNLIFTLPAAAKVGDVLIVFANAVSNTQSWSGPGGSSSFTSVYNPGTGWAIFTRVVNGFDAPGSTTYTFSQVFTPVAARGSMLIFRNAVYDTIGTAASGSPASAPSITLANNKSYVIAYYRDTGSATFTTPAGFTSLVAVSGGPGYAIFGKYVNAGATGAVESTGSAGNISGILVGLGPL